MRKHGPWTIEASSQKYRNEHMEVREDQVCRPDGKPGSYATVQLTCGVASLLLDDQGMVYLTRQFRYALGEESIEVACGGMETGEAPLEAAQREAEEELGITARRWTPLGVLDPDTSIIWGPVHLFLAQELEVSTPKREGTEVMTTVTYPLEEAVRMVMDGEITHGVSSVLILKVWVLQSRGG